MSLSEVVVDHPLWAEAPDERRVEWEALIHELLAPDTLAFREDAERLMIRMDETRFELEARSELDSPLVLATLPLERLSDLLTEYVDIVRQLGAPDDSASLSRLEALDMAKKVTHDKAGRMIRRLAPDLGLDLETARRLFSLLFSLRVDTTKLLGAHGHRTAR